MGATRSLTKCVQRANSDLFKIATRLREHGRQMGVAKLLHRFVQLAARFGAIYDDAIAHRLLAMVSRNR